MSVPPQPMPPNEGRGRRESVPAWEYPGLDPKLKRFLKRDGAVEVGGKPCRLDEGGYVELGGVRYMVLTGIDTPEVSVKLPLGVNGIFDGSCKVMGEVSAAGRVRFLGPVEAKAVSASAIKFEGGITAWGNVQAREGNIEGRGDVQAKEVKARDNISVFGDVRGQLIMAREGFLQANSLAGEAVLGKLGVNALTGAIGYESEKPRSERSICMVWSNEGRIYAAGGVATGKVCAGLDIQTSEGDLVLEGDAYCLSARIRGQVLDGAGNPAQQKVYSKYEWSCKDADGRTLRMQPKEIAPEDLVRKLEHSPFAIDRWDRYYAKYSED